MTSYSNHAIVFSLAHTQVSAPEQSYSFAWGNRNTSFSMLCVEFLVTHGRAHGVLRAGVRGEEVARYPDEQGNEGRGLGR